MTEYSVVQVQVPILRSLHVLVKDWSGERTVSSGIEMSETNSAALQLGSGVASDVVEEAAGVDSVSEVEDGCSSSVSEACMVWKTEMATRVAFRSSSIVLWFGKKRETMAMKPIRAKSVRRMSKVFLVVLFSNICFILSIETPDF